MESISIDKRSLKIYNINREIKPQNTIKIQQKSRKQEKLKKQSFSIMLYDCFLFGYVLIQC